MNFYTNVRQFGNKMLVRAIRNGERIQYEDEYKPYLFVSSADGDYKSPFGDRAGKVQFDSIREAKQFTEQYSDISNFNFYGMTQFVYPYINDKWTGEVQYDRDLINVVSLDIETMSDDGFPNVELANKAITVITISDGKKFVVIGIRDFKTDRDDVTYLQCRDEKELLLTFLKEYRKMDPDILTGWNIEFFDIPYLVNRVRNICGKEYVKMFSPWKFVRDKKQKNNNEEITTYDIFGVQILDYLAVYRKWTYTQQESYKLDHIAYVELDQRKLDYSEYGSLHNFYEQNFQKYVEYNIIDTELINKLDDKLKLIDLALALAYDAKLNYVDAYTSVRMWDVIIHNYLLEQKIVIPQFKRNDKPYSFVGGHVKNPILGKHDWVCSFDLNSLYPHLIMQYNISPEKYNSRVSFPGCTVDGFLDGVLNNEDITEHLNAENLTITPNGCLWNREGQGFLPSLMEKMYEDRSRFKRMMLDAKQKYEDTGNSEHLRDSIRYDKIQHAKKIQLNCAYGALGNEWFRWFNPNYAESVTMGGQFSIRWIEKKMNDYLNNLLKTDDDFIVASDTDSIYIVMDKFVKKFKPDAPVDEVVKYLDKICSKAIEPFINKSYEELAKYVNAFSQKMFMKREAIANKGIWTGKKHYILNVYNNEGVQYSEPKLKIMGIEAVRSSTPQSCRESIKSAISLIMNRDESNLIDYVQEFRDKFFKMSFEEVAFPRGMNGINKYRDGDSWRSGTPIHVRGALIYNRMLEKHKLTKTVEKIRDGDKIKFCYLKQPNPTMENVISAIDSLPKEFILEDYIDYETQFEKNFLSPLRSITDVIDWQLEQRSTLESFFS